MPSAKHLLIGLCQFFFAQSRKNFFSFLLDRIVWTPGSSGGGLSWWHHRYYSTRCKSEKTLCGVDIYCAKSQQSERMEFVTDISEQIIDKERKKVHKIPSAQNHQYFVLWQSCR